MIKRYIPFIFAGLLGMGAVYLVQQYVQSERRALEAQKKKLLEQFQAIAPIDVVVARKDIPEEAQIIADMLDTKQIPKAFVQPYATSRAMDLLNMVAKVPIAAGEQVLTNKVRSAEARSKSESLAAITPKGMRAVTIGADMLTGVGGFVRPGDKVDVVWSLQVPRPDTKEPDLVTITLFQGVDVLAVGRDIAGRAAQEEAPSGEHTVTLSLTPEQTAVILYAREQGRVQLSLRSKTDKGEAIALTPTDMDAVMQAVMGEGKFPSAAKQAPRTVEVFKGLEKSLVAVSE